LKTIHTLLVNVPHNQYYFRVLIGKENSQWVPAVFVISRGESNPLHYCDSVYHLLTEFLRDYNIDVDKCRLYLDLTEYLGLIPHLFKWNMRTKGNKLHSSVEQVTVQDLHDVDVAVLSQYYEDKWSIFTQSLLTNHEKAELLAQNLAGSIFDEHIFEDIQAEIKYKLSKTIQST
jgi:hypothetical protein